LAAVEATDWAIDGTVREASREEGRPGRWVNVLEATAGATGSTGCGLATAALLPGADLVLAGAAGTALVALTGGEGLLVLTGGIVTLGVTDRALAFGAVLEAGLGAALAATVLAGEGFREGDFLATAGVVLAAGLLGFVVFPGFAFTS
jgi:hypothetical protein